ncbi:hypothetical protein DXA59_02780 [Clostridium sp. OF03-18AA]|nr:hypothetical protein DXA59_02780 [Clostridium sp. OF03-18AA]
MLNCIVTCKRKTLHMQKKLLARHMDFHIIRMSLETQAIRKVLHLEMFIILLWMKRVGFMAVRKLIMPLILHGKRLHLKRTYQIFLQPN